MKLAKTSSLLSFAMALLSGCNTMSVPAERALHAQQKSCCSSVGTLPLTPRPAMTPLQLELTAATPHFDSGEGLAPFQLLAVDPSKDKRIEVAALNRGASTLTDSGNDNYFRVAYVSLKFFDAARKPVAAKAVGPNNIVVGVSGQYSASWLAEVPQGAAFVMVTVDPSKVDSPFVGCVRPRSPAGDPVLDQCVSFPAGQLKFEWKGWMYGKVLVAFRG